LNDAGHHPGLCLNKTGNRWNRPGDVTVVGRVSGTHSASRFSYEWRQYGAAPQLHAAVPNVAEASSFQPRCSKNLSESIVQ
jgi:hypothetical protein